MSRFATLLPLLLAPFLCNCERASEDSSPQGGEPCTILASIGPVPITSADLDYVRAEMVANGQTMTPRAALLDVAWQEHERQRAGIGLDEGRKSLTQARAQAVRHYLRRRKRGLEAMDMTRMPPSARLTPCGAELHDL